MKTMLITMTYMLVLTFNGTANSNTMLGKKEQSIVVISSLSATGDLKPLTDAFNTALDNGMTINEAKEILIQIAAYCGFPRSLNAINTLNEVLKQRIAKGIHDPIGIEPRILPENADRYAIGKKTLERLTGRPETTKAGYAVFVPAIEVFLKEHLFADIFYRGVLTDKERELITVSALSSLGGVSSQLQGHLSISMHLGYTKPQLKEMLAIVCQNAGNEKADEGVKVLDKVALAREQ